MLVELWKNFKLFIFPEFTKQPLMVADIPCSSEKNNKSGWRKGGCILGRISELQIHKQLALQ